MATHHLNSLTQRNQDWMISNWKIGMRFSLLRILAVGFLLTSTALSAFGQTGSRSELLPTVQPLLNDTLAPGIIGATQLQRQPNLRGYFQPVEIRGPAGMKFALVSEGMFTENYPQPLRAALLVGNVYRFRCVGILGEPEAEIFPSLEIIDRTYPPAEREHRHPIIVELDDIDIEAALRGDMVIRVIYLEDSSIAEPVSYAEGPQRVFEVGLRDDALNTADVYGRPLAILRIGSRVPDAVEGPEAYHFHFGSPPWMPIKAVPKGKTLSDISFPEMVQP